MRPTRWMVPVLAALAVFALALPTLAQTKVKVVFHVMSKCPYAMQAFSGFLPAFQQLRRHVDWRLEHIVTEENGYSGGRGKRDFLGALCGAITARRKPAPCLKIPPQPLISYCPIISRLARRS